MYLYICIYICLRLKHFARVCAPAIDAKQGGSPIRVHLGAAVAVAEKHLQVLDSTIFNNILL